MVCEGIPLHLFIITHAKRLAGCSRDISFGQRHRRQSLIQRLRHRASAACTSGIHIEISARENGERILLFPEIPRMLPQSLIARLYALP